MTRQRPLFLVSLPRSGSTLVQRVLASHEEISTTAEPWLLLPQMFSVRERDAYAPYGQVPAARAIREFTSRLPNGEDDYWAEVRRFTLRLYSLASQGRGAYFLDKTPRYHLVASDLFRVFPDGKFIFLWRNPLAILASIVQTWSGNTWRLDRWHVDLFDGLASMVAGYQCHAREAWAVRYEDLVGDPLHTWPPLFEYLGLPFDPAVLRDFHSLRLNGRMGDRAGPEWYQEISTEPLDKWRAVLSTSLRKRWCRNYINWIGGERLAVMGYDQVALLAELDSLPSGSRLLGSDMAAVLYGGISHAVREAAVARLTRRHKAERRSRLNEPACD